MAIDPAVPVVAAALQDRPARVGVALGLVDDLQVNDLADLEAACGDNCELSWCVVRLVRPYGGRRQRPVLQPLQKQPLRILASQAWRATNVLASLSQMKQFTNGGREHRWSSSKFR